MPRMFVWLGFGILFPILPLLIALVLGVIGTGMGVWYVIFRTKAETPLEKTRSRPIQRRHRQPPLDPRSQVPALLDTHAFVENNGTHQSPSLNLVPPQSSP